MPTLELIAEIKFLKGEIKKLKSTAEYKKKYIKRLEIQISSLKHDNKILRDKLKPWMSDNNVKQDF